LRGCRIAAQDALEGSPDGRGKPLIQVNFPASGSATIGRGTPCAPHQCQV